MRTIDAKDQSYTFRNYSSSANTTINPELDRKQNMINASLGLAGEVGEVVDHVKKYIYHGHPLDHDKIEKELGDVLWYINQMCYALNVPIECVAKDNIEKLARRYPEGFTSERSFGRKVNE